MSVMTLREFDDYMTEGGFEYSLMVLSWLDDAATLHIMKRDGMAYIAQVDALALAEAETTNGKVLEPLLPYLSMRDERMLKTIYNKWKTYLVKIGRQIQEVTFDVK